ncbi:hypothetical protein BS50DRAFT_562753 [Corynespora cassiicola Philippines]|uniref:Prion-inhibition and propagation HeLo domain-containing protein n=1 Tax=Corynespora cassiicola Philippines TaxID=1448308 RepID=A0A2T2N753_CORCC|nr:hypothetical protein BS50DRAFT_562753 [Corynespora cassiicola Philippines]
MEASSLAIGTVTLAGLFNNAVDCFEYVQLGRNFGTNFQTSLLKLDNARLRLSRWGQAVGLSGSVEHARSLQESSVKIEDIPKAEKVLGQILELFVESEKISARYKISVGANSSNTAILDANADLDAVGQYLHEKMRKLCINRQNGSTLRHKARWALYEEKRLHRLIEDIIELIDDLVGLFPAIEEAQRKLCEAEVSEIGAESLSTLIEIIRSQDKDLEKAISDAMKAADYKQSTTYNNYHSKIANQATTMSVYGGQTINL